VNKDQFPSVEMLRIPAGRGRSLVAVTAMLALGACSAIDKREVGTIGHVRGFAGIVAADEPRAVQAGRDVLSAGGTAADAAAAMYFTMAVTYPSAASLGGGGSCIVHDKGKKKTEVMEFPAVASVMASASPSAVPANPRGFFALHAKYGKLRFESLLADAERLARIGVPVSRALANDLSKAVPILGRDPAARAVFFDADGSVLKEGDLLRQPELAAVIANLRRNTGDFYTGMAARDLVKSVQAAGGSLVLEDLRDVLPVWRETLRVKTGLETAHFAPPPSVGSTVTAQLVGALWGRWRDAPAGERPHLLAEASARVYADRGRWMRPSGRSDGDPTNLIAPERLAAMMADYQPDRHVPVSGVAGPPNDFPLGAGLVVMDAKGSTVACGVTNHGLFGNGRVAPGTGIVLSAVPGPSGPPPITTMMTINHNVEEVRFAGTASGGATAPPALVSSFLAAIAEARPLKDAVATPRLVHPGTPDAVFIEAEPYAVDPAPLQQRGHQVGATPMPSRVQALVCRDGFTNPESCEVATDPRGFGMATLVGKP
jgi:gamma-glutamyltranspeptidase/glutathione hydrolase